MSYWDDWENFAQPAGTPAAPATIPGYTPPPLTALGQSLYPTAAPPPPPPFMGIPQAGTGQATPAYGGNFQYDIAKVLAGNGQGWGDISQGVGANQGTNDYSKWLHFQGNDGTPLAAWKNYAPDTLTGEGMDKERQQGALLGYNVIKDPGDFGGTGFGSSHESKLNGMDYDYLNPDGTFNSKGKLSGFTDSGDGDAMGVLKIFLSAVGGGALGNAAAAAGAGAGASAGAAGSLASEMAALGAGGGAVAGGTAASTAASIAAAEAAAGGGAVTGGGVTAADIAAELAGSGLSFGAPLGAEAVTAASGLAGGASLEAIAGALGMTPEAFSALGAAGTGAAGAAAGQLAGTAAGSEAGGALSTATADAQAAGQIFNPAVDSQIASEGLGITGSQAAADAAAAAIPSVTVNGVPTAAAGAGALSGIKDSIAKTLAELGITGKDAAAIGATILAATQGGNSPTLGNGSGGSGVATNQAEEAKKFLETVMPFIRYDTNGPGGSSAWTKDASGKYTLNQSLDAGSQGLFDSSTSKLNELIGSANPNTKAGYSEELAKTIFDRTWGMQQNDISQQRSIMQSRLAEQGFVPGNEGYVNESNRWEDQINEARQNVSKDAQIQAFTQGTQEATANSNIRSQLAQILGGARASATGNLEKQSTQGSAPTGAPANTVTASQNQYTADLAAQQAKNAQVNDIVKALMNWGFSG